jgi:hypothetical protein
LEGQTCLLSGGAPNNLVHHRTAGARSPFFSSASDRWSSGSIGAPDTVRCISDSPVCPTDRCCGPHVACRSRGRPLALATVGAGDRCAPPDSPVNYSHTPLCFLESSQFTVGQPGTPDTVRCAWPDLVLAELCRLFFNLILLFLALFLALR